MKTVEELQEELEKERARAKALEANKSRIESESKAFKARAQEAESKISESEKSKLEEQGKLEELLATERQEKSDLSKKLEMRTQSVLREKLRSEAAKFAKDAHDIDMLLKVGEYKDLLSINEDDLTVEGVEDFVGKVRETHSYLFKKKTLDETETKRPSKGEGKTEEERYFAELDVCNSSRELDAVKKKYGRL